jgi:hypothetical protein
MSQAGPLDCVLIGVARSRSTIALAALHRWKLPQDCGEFLAECGGTIALKLDRLGVWRQPLDVSDIAMALERKMEISGCPFVP